MVSLLQHLYEQPSVFERTTDFRAFYEDMAPEELSRLEGLWSTVVAAHEGDAEAAARYAEAAVRGMPDDDDEHGALAIRTFAESLLGRLRHQTHAGGNLYLDARPPGAQLRAYELLRLRTPLIPFAYAAANRALIDAMSQEPDVTLIDVGIGRGGQLRSLLRNPLARRWLRSLHVVGVEPDSSAQGTGALQVAEDMVLKSGKEVGITTTFHAIAKRAEDLSVADIEEASPRGLVLGNATLALHHTVGAEGDGEPGRERALRVLRDAEVQSIILVEPDSNHHTDELASRFLFAYRHYRSVARALRSQLGAADARLVWQEFFAPEVHNVVAHEGRQRTERHEESATWVERLERTGWRSRQLRGLLPQAAAPDGFTVRDHGPSFSLRFQNVSLLSVIGADR